MTIDVKFGNLIRHLTTCWNWVISSTAFNFCFRNLNYPRRKMLSVMAVSLSAACDPLYNSYSSVHCLQKSFPGMLRSRKFWQLPYGVTVSLLIRLRNWLSFVQLLTLVWPLKIGRHVEENGRFVVLHYSSLSLSSVHHVYFRRYP